MSFNWLQYLNLAKELADEAATSANPEAQLRAAIHLAYYAAFNLAKDHLRDNEGIFIPKTSNAHKYVAEQFKLNPDPVRQLLAGKLRHLRSFRNQADYVRFFPGLAGFTTIALTSAEEVISILSSL